MTFFEWLFGIPKSPEQIKAEIEYSNEENYRTHKLKTLQEAEQFRELHAEVIEYNLGKPISEVTLNELIKFGFNSTHFTKKHMKELEL